MGFGNSKQLPVPALEQPLPQRDPVRMLAKLWFSKIAASFIQKCGTQTQRPLGHWCQIPKSHGSIPHATGGKALGTCYFILLMQHWPYA